MIKSYDSRTLSRKDRDDVLERDGNKCQYCGGDAETVDHIIPWSHAHSNAVFNLVACCQICNSVASNKVFDTFIEKKNHIITRRLQMLSRRAVPIWTNEEIKGLGGHIRDMVISTCIVVADISEGEIIARRLAQDGFSVTFGRGGEIKPEQLLSQVYKIKEESSIRRDDPVVKKVNKSNQNRPCLYCGVSYYRTVENDYSWERRKWCGHKCGSLAHKQRTFAIAAVKQNNSSGDKNASDITVRI